MAQVPGNGYTEWAPYGHDFSGNGGHDQGFGDFNIDPSLGDNMNQFDLSGSSSQIGHSYAGYEGQGDSRPTSTQPYTNATFSYPQTTDQSLGHAQAVNQNGQYMSPARGQPTQVQGSHDFGSHQYPSGIDVGPSFTATSNFPAGGSQAYHGAAFDSQYLSQPSFTNDAPIAAQQHSDYVTPQTHHVNDTMANNLHPQSGQLDPVWNRPGSAVQYQNSPIQTQQRDSSSFAQISPYSGSRMPGGMSLPPSTEPQHTQPMSGHAHFPMQGHSQRDSAEARTPQPQWQSPQKPFAPQPSTAYLQQQTSVGVHQAASQPQSGRGTPLQQQSAVPFTGHYSPAPTNSAHVPPQTVSPSPGYAQQHQQFTAPQGLRPAQAHPVTRVAPPQVVQATNNAVPASRDNVSHPMAPSIPNARPSLALPRVLPAFTTKTVQAENAKATGSKYASFLTLENGPYAPKHMRPFNPVAVDPDKKLGMAFPDQRQLPCEIIFRLKNAAAEERRALEKQLKQHLGDPLPAQYRAILKGSDKGTTASDDEDLEAPAQSDVRPEDPAEAASWDAIQIVDFDRVSSTEPVNTRVGKAVAKLGELIKGLMAPVKSASDALDVARKAKKESSEMSRLKAQVIAKTRPLYKAVDAAEDNGDSQVLANLGGNQRLVVDLTNALRVANNIGDHNGDFAKAVLRLMSHSKTITSELLGKTNWPKVKEKFLEKGDEEVKDLVKAIADNAAARSALNKDKQPTAEGTKTPSSSQIKPTSAPTKKMAPGDSAKKKPGSSTARVPSDSSSTKRPRDDEPDSRNVKKQATDPAASSSSQSTTKPTSSKLNAGTSGSASTSQAKSWSGSALLPGKSKPVAKPAPKPVLSKADSSKPDMAKLPSFKKSDPSKAKKPDITKSDASPAGSSKLGAILDEITKPKPAKATQAAATPDSSSETPETPEERQRRLRKEQRRKLRVSWKEGDELTQIRIFHKDIAEDEGRAVNMIRDARDDRAEGMLLKQGMTLDEDDEEELPYRPWFEPLAIDFATIPQEKRDNSFVSRGGNKAIHTPQQDYIAERENRELMVIYTDPADIPPTPKSPPPPSQQERDIAVSPGVTVTNSVANNQEIQQRWTEVAHMGLSWALYNAVRRAEAQNPSVAPSSRSDIDANAILHNLGSMAQQNASSSTQQYGRSAAPVAGGPAATAASRDAQVYALLTSDKVKNYKDPDPYNPAYPKTHRRHDYSDPEVQKAADAVEAVAEQLRGKPFPPAEPPTWLRSDQARVDEWYHGYNKDRQRAHEEQTRTQVPPVQVPQPQPAAANGMANNQYDMAAIAAYYAQNQPQNPANAQQQAAWAQYYQSMLQQNQPAQQLPAAQPAVDQNAQLQSLLARLGSGQQGPPAPASSAAAPGADPQWQALLAGLASAPQTSQPYQNGQATSVPNVNDPNYVAYMTALAQQWGTGQTQAGNNAQAGAVPNYDQQRQQKSHGSSSRSSGARGGAKSAASNDNIPPHLRGINRDKIGTKPCVFWANGTCNKGDKCTFRHD